MKLTSNWTRGKLFWRTFAKADTVYIVGLREGNLANGESIEYNNPDGFFQMEIKGGDLFGKTLMAAGRVFNNDDEWRCCIIKSLLSKALKHRTYLK